MLIYTIGGEKKTTNIFLTLFYRVGGSEAMKLFDFLETEKGYEACIYNKHVSIDRSVLLPKKGLMLDNINNTSAGRQTDTEKSGKPQITIFCVGSLKSREEVISLFLKMAQEEKLQHKSNRAVTSSACMLDGSHVAIKVTCETLSGARSKIVRLDSLKVAKVVIKNPENGLLKISPTKKVNSWNDIKTLVHSMDCVDWTSESKALIDNTPMISASDI